MATSICSWKDLFPESDLPPPSFSHRPTRKIDSNNGVPPPQKAFAQALHNTSDTPLSQLPVPCVKDGAIDIKIPEEEYIAGVKSCKNNLHGCLMLMKGDNPDKIDDLRAKLLMLRVTLSTPHVN